MSRRHTILFVYSNGNITGTCEGCTWRSMTYTPAYGSRDKRIAAIRAEHQAHVIRVTTHDLRDHFAARRMGWVR
jgi:hypothetical protein